MKPLLFTLIYLSGAFSIGFDSHGVPYAQNCYWQEKIQAVSGRRLQQAQVIRRPDFESKLNRLSSWQQKFYRVKAWVSRRKFKGFAVVYAPPIIEGRIRYFAGMADKCKPYNGVAMVWANDVNQDGASRIYNTQVTAAHEVGHIFGALHDDSLPVTIMHSQAAHPGGIHPFMSFSETSKQQIRKCLGARL